MTSMFVTGALRSGTTLAQMMLTNHPQLLVAYQPFHQFHVDVKRMFLSETGISGGLPLDDGSPTRAQERAQFPSWLARRRFSEEEATRLAAGATTGKGGGLMQWHPIGIPAGSFFDVRSALHRTMATLLSREPTRIVGSKEILCEEYVPALIEAGVRCLLVIRDPRGMVASANGGRYLEQVGDRYPLLMLIRLWRKSAGYWLKYRDHPLVCAIRYEDLVADPETIMDGIANWLGVGPFPDGFLRRPLHDHYGHPWLGNSSFGDKATVDASAAEGWRVRLPTPEIRFISALTKPELHALSYPIPNDLSSEDIFGFEEDVSRVRPAYLSSHRIDTTCRRDESARLKDAGALLAGERVADTTRFLFPDALFSMDRVSKA